MIELLALAGGLGTTGALVAVVVLAFKLVRCKDDVIAAGDQIDKWRGEATTVQNQLAVEEQAHGVTMQRFNEERDLRAVVESQLNQARRRVHELLAAHLKEASDDEIRAATAAAFGGLSPLSETADGRLLRPGEDADVQPT